MSSEIPPYIASQIRYRSPGPSAHEDDIDKSATPAELSQLNREFSTLRVYKKVEQAYASILTAAPAIEEKDLELRAYREHVEILHGGNVKATLEFTDEEGANMQATCHRILDLLKVKSPSSHHADARVSPQHHADARMATPPPILTTSPQPDSVRRPIAKRASSASASSTPPATFASRKKVDASTQTEETPAAPLREAVEKLDTSTQTEQATLTKALFDNAKRQLEALTTKTSALYTKYQEAIRKPAPSITGSLETISKELTDVELVQKIQELDGEIASQEAILNEADEAERKRAILEAEISIEQASLKDSIDMLNEHLSAKDKEKLESLFTDYLKERVKLDEESRHYREQLFAFKQAINEEKEAVQALKQDPSVAPYFANPQLTILAYQETILELQEQLKDVGRLQFLLEQKDFATIGLRKRLDDTIHLFEEALKQREVDKEKTLACAEGIQEALSFQLQEIAKDLETRLGDKGLLAEIETSVSHQCQTLELLIELLELQQAAASSSDELSSVIEKTQEELIPCRIALIQAKERLTSFQEVIAAYEAQKVHIASQFEKLKNLTKDLPPSSLQSQLQDLDLRFFEAKERFRLAEEILLRAEPLQQEVQTTIDASRIFPSAKSDELQRLNTALSTLQEKMKEKEDILKERDALIKTLQTERAALAAPKEELAEEKQAHLAKLDDLIQKTWHAYEKIATLSAPLALLDELRKQPVNEELFSSLTASLAELQATNARLQDENTEWLAMREELFSARLRELKSSLTKHPDLLELLKQLEKFYRESSAEFEKSDPSSEMKALIATLKSEIIHVVFTLDTKQGEDKIAQLCKNLSLLSAQIADKSELAEKKRELETLQSMLFRVDFTKH